MTNLAQQYEVAVIDEIQVSPNRYISNYEMLQLLSSRIIRHFVHIRAWDMPDRILSGNKKPYSDLSWYW
jgi:hypothetical protein